MRTANAQQSPIFPLLEVRMIKTVHHLFSIDFIFLTTFIHLTVINLLHKNIA